MVHGLTTTQKIRLYKEEATPKVDIEYLEKKIEESKKYCPDFSELDRIYSKENGISSLLINVCGGTVMCEKVYYVDNCAILQAEFPKGSCFQMHTHDEMEIGVVISGELEIEYDDNTKDLMKEQEIFIIYPKVGHSIKTEKGAKAIVLTVPASKSWPK
jgi:quercetin dioxygenase-like cupin family protein